MIETLEPVTVAVRAGQGTPELTEGVLPQVHVLNAEGRYTDAAALAQLCLDHPEITDVPTALSELARQKSSWETNRGRPRLDQLKAVDGSGLEAAATTYQCAEAA